MRNTAASRKNPIREKFEWEDQEREKKYELESLKLDRQEQKKSMNLPWVTETKITAHNRTIIY